MTAEVTNTRTVSPTLQHEINGIKPELQLRMHHYFEASCDATPEATALEWEGGKATYAQLDASANRLAHFLRDQGVGQQARVGLFLPRSHLMYAALLGAMKAGAAFVPIDPSSPTDRVEYVATDAALDLLITTAEKLPVVQSLEVQLLVIDEALPQIEQMPSERIELDLS